MSAFLDWFVRFAVGFRTAAQHWYAWTANGRGLNRMTRRKGVYVAVVARVPRTGPPLSAQPMPMVVSRVPRPRLPVLCELD